jgi:hypothetical protein
VQCRYRTGTLASDLGRQGPVNTGHRSERAGRWSHCGGRNGNALAAPVQEGPVNRLQRRSGWFGSETLTSSLAEQGRGLTARGGSAATPISTQEALMTPSGIESTPRVTEQREDSSSPTENRGTRSSKRRVVTLSGSEVAKIAATARNAIGLTIWSSRPSRRLPRRSSAWPRSPQPTFVPGVGAPARRAPSGPRPEARLRRG